MAVSAAGGVKKAWMDAAVMMLVTGSFRYARLPMMQSAAVVSRGGPTTTPVCLEEREGITEDMQVLLVQRSKKSGFMPNAYVFPGGVVDKADYSPKWMDLFQECTAPNKHPFSPILELNRSGRPKLPMYDGVKDTPILGEIAFRICAIREMFEEAGVLLARDKSDVERVLDFLPGSFSPSVKVLPVSSQEEWRRRMHSNAEEFLTLCRELQCVPDIWSLIEQSNILTPRNLHRRYDTVFYLCFCENRPSAIADGEEVFDAKWLSPMEAIQSEEIVLAPPQFVEVHRLQRFGTAPCLHSHALYKNIYGSNYRTEPVRIVSKDGVEMVVMNRDDLYPAEGGAQPRDEVTGTVHHPQSPALSEEVSLLVSQHPLYEYECPTHTAEELREMSTTTQRVELCDEYHRFVDNVMPRIVAEHMERYTHTRGLTSPQSKL